MKPSVAALICPEANTSMPALIAEAKHAEKCANMEYAAHNVNCSSNGNGRENFNGNCGTLTTVMGDSLRVSR
ncbi:hypothetical protein DSO57_1016993 [Entomophthora muscae]|uniref:Uncharacterized protein n=1 Tax=Entomophthora muscae TaxID=34485 RepID=A0ACC2RJD9_9FUNG|nr:hypothetical protein DSO57_1016993 [Entomophthora muscae]